MIFDLSKTTAIANTFVAEMRDEVVQKDAMRFRKNLERLGAFLPMKLVRN